MSLISANGRDRAEFCWLHVGMSLNPKLSGYTLHPNTLSRPIHRGGVSECSTRSTEHRNVA